MRKIDNKILYFQTTKVSELITVEAIESLSDISNNTDKAGWDLFGEVYVYEVTIRSPNKQTALSYNIVFKE